MKSPCYLVTKLTRVYKGQPPYKAKICPHGCLIVQGSLYIHILSVPVCVNKDVLTFLVCYFAGRCWLLFLHSYHTLDHHACVLLHQLVWFDCLRCEHERLIYPPCVWNIDRSYLPPIVLRIFVRLWSQVIKRPMLRSSISSSSSSSLRSMLRW